MPVGACTDESMLCFSMPVFHCLHKTAAFKYEVSNTWQGVFMCVRVYVCLCRVLYIFFFNIIAMPKTKMKHTDKLHLQTCFTMQLSYIYKYLMYEYNMECVEITIIIVWSFNNYVIII